MLGQLGRKLKNVVRSGEGCLEDVILWPESSNPSICEALSEASVGLIHGSWWQSQISIRWPSAELASAEDLVA